MPDHITFAAALLLAGVDTATAQRAAGGPLALVWSGDLITLDGVARPLQLNIKT